MKVESLSELKKLLKACQEFGVHSIEIDGIKMLIGEPKVALEAGAEGPSMPTDLSEEELLMWSAGGIDG